VGSSGQSVNPDRFYCAPIETRKNPSTQQTTPNFYEKIAILGLTAALLCGTAFAGTLMLDNSSPAFNPTEDFTNNMINVSTVDMGGKVDLEGLVTVAPVTITTAEITISGTYSADPGDKFSADYRFSADLNNPEPVEYTIPGQRRFSASRKPLRQREAFNQACMSMKGRPESTPHFRSRSRAISPEP